MTNIIVMRKKENGNMFNWNNILSHDWRIFIAFFLKEVDIELQFHACQKELSDPLWNESFKFRRSGKPIPIT